jgi:aspartate-semialdehyde dehydrogenase
MAKKPTLAVVGATGAVGTVMLDILSTRPDVWGEIKLLASSRSAGKVLKVRGKDVVVEELTEGVDVAMFDVPDEVSAKWAPIAAAKGVVAVDNSGAFRMDKDVPLVVPEVNSEQTRNRPRGIISNPNCTTLSMIVVVGALEKAFGVKELIVASYQAASGAGQAGIDTLHEQMNAVAGKNLGSATKDVRNVINELDPFPAPLAMNVVPWAGSLQENDYTSEELKVRNESRKILGKPELKVHATCVRVPVVTTHSLAVHAVLDRAVTANEIRELLANSQGIVVMDDPENRIFPTPIDVVDTDPTAVGRIRVSPEYPNEIDFFVCGDNLRKGAALNTAQIAEEVAKEFN